MRSKLIPPSLGYYTMAGGGTSGPVVYDTFTGDDATALTSHTPDIAPVGSSWAATIGAGSLVIISNKANAPDDINSSRGCTIDSGLADCTITAVVGALEYSSASNYNRYPAIIFRYNGTTHWRFALNKNLSKGELSLGSTQVGLTEAVSIVIPFTLKVVLSDSSIICTVTCGENEYSVSASNATNKTETHHGVYCYKPSYDNIDNFTVTA